MGDHDSYLCKIVQILFSLSYFVMNDVGRLCIYSMSISLPYWAFSLIWIQLKMRMILHQGKNCIRMRQKYQAKHIQQGGEGRGEQRLSLRTTQVASGKGPDTKLDEIL